MMNLFTRLMESTEAGGIELQFHPIEFLNNLKYMGLGMLGIFVVIGLIVLATVALNKCTSLDLKKKKKQ